VDAATAGLSEGALHSRRCPEPSSDTVAAGDAVGPESVPHGPPSSEQALGQLLRNTSTWAFSAAGECSGGGSSYGTSHTDRPPTTWRLRTRSGAEGHHRWEGYCDAAGVDIDIHQLRHAHATELNAGVSIEAVRRRVGHASTETTPARRRSRRRRGPRSPTPPRPQLTYGSVLSANTRTIVPDHRSAPARSRRPPGALAGLSRAGSPGARRSRPFDEFCIRPGSLFRDTSAARRDHEQGDLHVC
jgi:hypothetical protein